MSFWRGKGKDARMVVELDSKRGEGRIGSLLQCELCEQKRDLFL